VALEPYTDDETWLWAFDEVVPPLYRALEPDLLLVQLGADGYFADPLAHLLLTERAYVEAARRLRELTGGRLAAVGGGGYDVRAAPRIWAAEFLTLAGRDVPADLIEPEHQVPALDADLRAMVRRVAERTVATIKELVFPRWGI
jgi:acetoin utilization protein AcuC